jgi:murein DD-endopeptidase MepM/ murein hydrolase activator NlpD
MASSRNADINLIIRARDDASKSIEPVARALDSLLGDATDASGGVAELGKTLGALDRAFAAISGKADAAGAAFDRQQSALAANKAQLAAIVAQAEAASRALTGLREGIVDEVLAGRDQAPIIAQIKAVEQEQASLANRAEKLTRTIAAQESAANGSRSALLQLGATVHAVEDAQAVATARIELTTQALNEQAAAAQRVTAIQQRINDVTGVSRPASAGSAAAAASVLVEADEIFLRTEARTAEIQKLREQEAATAALADAERAEQANRARFNITDDPREARARVSAAAFIEAAEGEERMAREAAHLRAQLDPLAAIQDRFNASLARYRELAAAGKLGADELARAEQHLAAEAEQARAALERNGRAAAGEKPGLFGLRPYELTNLGYQINDVATQLASGTSLTQTLGQQAGQILQIFPRITSAILGAFRNPAFLGAAAVLGTIIAGLKEAGEQAERLREFTATLAFRADGGSYDAGTLARQAASLERLGASAKDADAAINALVDQGVAADAIGGLGRAAQETAERLGQSLPEAAKAAAEAFTGGYDAIAQFDDKLQFLTASEREHIRALFDSGNAEAARTEARLAYQRMEDGIAAKSRGPWGEAARSLGNAWDSLIKFIAGSAPIKITIGVLNELAGAVKEVGDAISGALGDGKPAAAGVSARIGQVQAQIRDLQKTITDYETAIAKGSPIAGTLQHVVNVSKRQLSRAQSELAVLERNAPDTINDNPNGVRAKQRAERLTQIEAEQQLQALRQRGQAGLSRADSQRRAQLAGELAYRQEMASTGDAIVAARLREIAVAKEQGDIDKANEQARKNAAKERERLARQTQFIDPVQGRVSSGFGPRSSPGGVGSTFHKGIDYAVPVGTNVRAPAAGVVIETGTDARLGRYVLIDHGNNVQSKFGHLSDNEVVRAGQDVAQGQLIGRSGNTGSATTGAHLHYTVLVNGRPVDPRKGIFVGDGPARFEVNRGEALQDYEDALEDRGARQEQFNIQVRQEVAARQQAIDALKAEAGLYGTALLAEQRRQAVAEAELELRQRAEDANRNLKPGLPPIIVTDEQVVAARDLAAALFDAQNARDSLNARLGDAQRPVDALTAQRDLLRDQAEFLRSIGETTRADTVEEQIRALGGDIRQAYDELIAFYAALSTAQRVELGILDQSQLDNLIARLGQAKEASQEWGKVLGVSGQQVAQAFAGAAANALNGFIERIASGRNVFKALGQSAREFAANFISSIAQALVQLLAFAAAVQVLRALGVPVPASFGVGQHHNGGIAGASAGGVRRTAVPEMFVAALRYHKGGIAGFAPDEVPAILKRNEEVLTEGDPRHRFNGGLSTGREATPAPINIVNAFDREQAAEMLLRTKTGERAILNVINENPGAVRAALGG